ncbi:MAG: 16S rRNA (adenine(1518)-N(6)/adenine(1519)-N(6))-dimethyltransferase RsmA [Bacteroidales bacterium]|jgi:16S rRNA (adenine1518-N6/adenine1519-N6)-dimethyltransferase|nr:16S rRNA (adenine(1518)-N(6)/adenine(1519)-N(6))-dimethyltransferase RsmA [Bacteroidales bacterium]
MKDHYVDKSVKAKKYLGQHFLTDEAIAQRIAGSLQQLQNVIEIGSGMGVLTKYLLDNQSIGQLKVVEIDKESVDYLLAHYPTLDVYNEDFLQMNLSSVFADKISIIGNFPYNISNQILFKVFDNKDMVDEVVGMFQKEVAQRVVASEGSKTYGILSVLLSAFYDMEYLFTVEPTVFNPPPKVKSAVIRMTRNQTKNLPCDEKLFLRVVKTAFNQRRKMLRSALKALQMDLTAIPPEYMTQRAEQLSVNQFISITKTLEQQI